MTAADRRKGATGRADPGPVGGQGLATSDIPINTFKNPPTLQTRLLSNFARAHHPRAHKDPIAGL